MVYRVVETRLGSARTLKTFGTRDMAEGFIRRLKPKTRQKNCEIREFSLPDGHPAMNFPYLPSVGH